MRFEPSTPAPAGWTPTTPPTPVGSHRYDPAAHAPATSQCPSPRDSSTASAYATATYAGAGPAQATSTTQWPAPEQPYVPGGAPPYGRPPDLTGPPGGSPPPHTAGPPRPPEPPRRRRDPSYLGLVTLSVMLIGVGVLAVLDIASVDVDGAAYVALALAVVATGLLVGTWFGRSRSLIAAGILLSIALVPTTLIDTATDGDWSQLGQWSEGESRLEVPRSPNLIEPVYDVGSGHLVLDLRNVDFDGDDVSTTLTMGAGEIEVIVPSDVDVVVSATVDLGELELFGAQSGGVDVDRDLTDAGFGAISNGELDLTIDVNVGRAEVRREAA